LPTLRLDATIESSDASASLRLAFRAQRRRRGTRRVGVRGGVLQQGQEVLQLVVSGQAAVNQLRQQRPGHRP
jgi:hypothetical protein